MQRKTSRLTGEDFWLIEPGDEIAAVHEGLPVLAQEDVGRIANEQHRLGREGLRFVFRRRRKGLTVERALWEWFQFKRNGQGMSPAAQEFFRHWDKIKKQVAPK